ncbi:MAG TPA: VTT domain-containing protein [Candidatus Thermoplasmatota archaeon]|jgi:uncharacterized membrane protein YdjX (TVP38/TMEM64 family)|nr:VTT domain-containing protein [Candidatus Thermoplasmatota archaeon]
MAPPLRVRVRLRLERGPRGEREDWETGLLEGGESVPTSWVATPLPAPGEFRIEHGHILADREHLLLQDLVRVEGGQVVVTSTTRLEGHPLGATGERLHRLGHPGRAANRFADVVWKQYHEVVDIFSDPATRRDFARAVRHPQLLTPRMQRTLLFLVLLSTVWVWLVGLLGLALASPRLSVAWNVLFTLYFASMGTNLFLPIPVEPIALASVGTLGIWLVVLSSAAGKAAGAWIIYALGPALRAGVAKLEARSRLTRAFMARAERFARRFGYAALGLMLAVPFSPFDIVPVYLFSGMGLRLRPFLLAVFAGFALRLLAVLLLGQALFGIR